MRPFSMHKPLLFFTVFGLACCSGLAPIATAQDAKTKPDPKSKPVATAPAKPFDPADFVIIEKGSLPIILSAPHGGDLTIPEAAPREGAGQNRTPGNFVTARDTRTTELAQATVAEIERRYGKKPYLVASLAHRRYLDPNRPPDLAYEHPNAELVFKRYHGALEVATKEVFEKFHTGVLIDIHGQGSKADTVFRGTKDGLTVKILQERHGAAAHTGPKSLFGLLSERGWTVHPTPHDQKEQGGFTGGYIVQHYGSHMNTGIDAIQLEFGGDYRAEAAIEHSASVLTDALTEYGSLYLKLPKPEIKAKSFQPKPVAKEKSKAASSKVKRTRVFVYTGEGTNAS